MSSRLDRIRAERDRLAAQVADHRATLDALSKDTIFSDAWKAQRRAQLTDASSARARALARAAVAAAARARASVEEDLRAAHARAEGRYDWQRVAVLTRELETRLAAPENALTGDTRLRRVAQLHEDARRKGDLDLLRALRSAAAPTLDAIGREPRHAMQASSLRLAFAADEESEQREVRALEQEAAAVERERLALRHAILAAEQAIEPHPTSIFDPVSPWAKEVLGESVADFGGGVWINGQPAVAGG